jgi:hypothetical protein
LKRIPAKQNFFTGCSEQKQHDEKREILPSKAGFLPGHEVTGSSKKRNGQHHSCGSRSEKKTPSKVLSRPGVAAESDID